MVVLTPMFEGERMRTCRCGHIGISSSIPERASFYAVCGHHTLCKPCHRRSATAQRQARTERRTPEERKELRKYQREQKRLEMSLPGKRERHAAAQRKSSKRRREQLGDRAWKELSRIDYALRRERNGKPLPSLDQVSKKLSSSREHLPIRPYRAWVQAMVDDVIVAEGDRSDIPTQARVADLLGVPSRRIRSWLHEYASVSYSTVDRAASRHGGTTVEEIYRDYGDGMTIKVMFDPKKGSRLAFVVHQWEPTKEEDVQEMIAVKVRLCRSPGCEETPAKESRFCEEHVEIFARVRQAMSGETEAFRKTIKKKGARPTCCNPACREPRVRADRYCDTCQAEGWDEDDIT